MQKALADGRFVVTWTDNSQSGGDTSGAAIRARVFNADGSQSVPEFLVNTTTLNNQDRSSVTALADGRFVITWSDSGDNINGAAIRGRIFNPDGTQSVPEFLINIVDENDQRDNTVTALPDGRFLVTWSDFSGTGGDDSGKAVRGRIFNADGTQSVPEFVINTTILDQQDQGSVTVLADGRLVVSWRDTSQSGGDTSASAVRAQVFDPRFFEGTAAGDLVTGGAYADSLSGHGGDDWLSGLGGDDTLDGGAGNDLLAGGSGSDALYAFEGDDTLTDGGQDGLMVRDFLFGGTGNDTYEVWNTLASAKDIVFENNVDNGAQDGSTLDIDTIISHGEFFRDFYSTGRFCGSRMMPARRSPQPIWLPAQARMPKSMGTTAPTSSRPMVAPRPWTWAAAPTPSRSRATTCH